jgi:two-component system response regulator HydG
MSGRVLVVDDDAAMCDLVARGLGKKGFDCVARTSAAEAFALAQAEPFDCVITDLNMRSMNGLELCQRIVAAREDLPVIVITAFGSLETAVGAIRAGAYDFVTKPLEIDALALTVARAAQHRALRREVKLLKRALDETRRFDDLIGASPPMIALRELMQQIVDSDASVLITGESGTGKEVVARTLHRRGKRKQGPFIAINCAAVAESLLESELFGHARGAFTDAHRQRDGLFVQAHGGILFLDEIGDMPAGMQAKLLRALQERRVRPVGADKELAFDVRIVAATNRDLESEIAEQRFREDLYFRINVIHLALPPLRARGTDILLLAQDFVDHFAAQTGKEITGISAAAAQRLLAYKWPGNVRELQNCIERAVAITRFSELAVDDLPERVRDYQSSHVLIAGEDPSELAPMDEVERSYIARVMDAVAGNKTLAAKVLGFDRKTLYNKLERYRIESAATKQK